MKHFFPSSIRWIVGFWVLSFLSAKAQTPFFELTSAAQMRTARPAIPAIQAYKLYQLKESEIRAYLANAPFESQPDRKPLQLAIPLPNGTVETFSLRQTQVLSPALAAELPTFKTFAGQGIAHPNYTIRMSLSSLGFEALIWGVDGDAVYFAKASTDSKDPLYTSYFAREARKATTTRTFGPMLRCGSVGSTTSKPTLPGLNVDRQGQGRVAATAVSMGSTVRTFRIGIATTGEWTRGAGGFPGVTDPIQLRTNALAVVVSAINRINGIYERELAARFILVNPSVSSANNLIFDDPSTDPYGNTDSEAELNKNQATLDNRLGNANYDIGHLFGTGGGGVAIKGALCSSTVKAQGYSARGTQTGDPFVVDYVAHEMGHQFGMDHTYNVADDGGACTTREASQAYEVASGSTIMSYVGICNEGRNLQQFNDFNLPSFHVASLLQANTHLTGEAAGCGTSAGSNAIPTVSAGNAYAIPRLTPFTLTAVGNDADAADLPNLLYSWEEFDLAPSASGVKGVPVNTYDTDDDGILRPLLRPYSPVASPQRTFPSLAFILNPQNNATPGENQPGLTYTGTHPSAVSGAVCPPGSTCLLGERLPAVARTMNFRVTVRDRRGGSADAATTVTVVNTPGAFRLTSFDSASTVQGGSQQTVTWNVVNTDQAPINCTNVQILLSTDGGQTFPTTLLASTPNDGSEAVTIPTVTSNQCRIKVMAVNNIFFDISNTNFTIVDPGNQPPVAAAIDNQTGTLDAPFTVTIPAFTDPENQALTYRAVGLPASLSLNASTRVISGTPATVGSFPVTIIATDPGNLTAGATFTLTINPAPFVPLVATVTATPKVALTTGSIVLTPSASGGRPPYRYTFSAYGATASTAQSATVTELSAGVQTFSAIVVDSTLPTNQTVTATVEVTVVAPGTAPVVGVESPDPIASERKAKTSQRGSNLRARVSTVSMSNTNDEVDVAVIRFERSPAVGTLVIDYRVDGTATPGVDYVELPGSLTFLDGQSSVDVEVIPIPDDASEQDETVMLNLIDEDGYDLNPAETSTTITIVGEPTEPSSLTITSFTCNGATNETLSRVDFVVGYSDGSFAPAIAPFLIIGVTGNGALGTTYSLPFDQNQSTLTVQDAATRSTYFVWNFRQACLSSPPSSTTSTPPSTTGTSGTSLTITSFTCNGATSETLNRVDFVVGYVNGSTTSPIAPIFINGVTGNGVLGTTYSLPFDQNQSTLSVQDAATRSTYFVWNFRQACLSSPPSSTTSTPPSTTATPGVSLTVTSFTCNGSTNETLNRVDFVLGYANGSPMASVAPIFINGVTGNGQLGVTYSLPFDRNQNTLTVQDAATRSTYFVWDFRQACVASPGRIATESAKSWNASILGNPANAEVVVLLEGAAGKSVTLELMTVSGQRISSRLVRPTTAKHQEVFLVAAQPVGMLVLRATGETHSQTLKVLKN